MYIEYKGVGLVGEARIGRVKFSKSKKSVHYQGKTFQSLQGTGFKANYFEVQSGDHYWISVYKKDGTDRLYGERLPIYIDQDVQKEYGISIRGLPEKVGEIKIN